MTTSDDQIQAFVSINRFLDKMGLLVNRNLGEIQGFLNSSAVELLEVAAVVTRITNERKTEAERLLTDAHLNPTSDVAEMAGKNQSSVDAIIDSALDGKIDDTAVEHEKEHALQRRESSQLSKRVEAIHLLEISLGELLNQLAGSLSSEDVMHQLLRNIIVNHFACSPLFNSRSESTEMIQPAQFRSALIDLHQRLKHQCKSTEESMMFDQAFSGISIETKSSEGREQDDLFSFFDFRKRYHDFLDLQLLTIREGYSKIIDDAMTTIFKINSAQDTSKKHASSIMAQQAGGGFQNVSAEQHAVGTGELLEGIDIKRRSLTELSMSKDLLDQMDNEVGEAIVRMMGSLSVGDVIAQRINNVVAINEAMQKIVSHIMSDIPQRLTTASVGSIIESCQNYTKKLFVSEEERKIFTFTMEDRAA